MAREKKTTKLDPRFSLPPGLEDLEYETVEELDGYDTEGDEFDIPDYEASVAYDDTSDDDKVYPPDYIRVVSQTVRTLPGGGQVVDVVLDLPDLEDGYKYDIRSTVN